MKNFKEKSLQTIVSVISQGNYKQTGENLRKICQFQYKLFDQGYVKRFIFIGTTNFYNKHYLAPLKAYDKFSHYSEIFSKSECINQQDREIIAKTIPEAARKPDSDDPYYALYDKDYILDFQALLEHQPFQDHLEIASRKYDALLKKDSLFKQKIDRVTVSFAAKQFNKIRVNYPKLFERLSESDREAMHQIIHKGAGDFLKEESLFRTLLLNLGAEMEIYPGHINEATEYFEKKNSTHRDWSYPNWVSIENNIDFLLKPETKAAYTPVTKLFNSEKQISNHSLQQSFITILSELTKFREIQISQDEKINLILQRMISNSYSYHHENNIERNLLKS